MSDEARRIERDSMGELDIPAEAYWGASTERAVRNFPISGLRLPRRFIRALAWIKKGAAGANLELGRLDAERADAIARAAEEVARGALDAHFPVDVFQTGSGTSTNMNANEVIANRAAELLGGRRGDRDRVHPNDHVNLGQSSNDVVPTALHVAAISALVEVLEPAVERLRETLAGRAGRFRDVVKTGRTHLQDATPIRLGQVFTGYAGQLERGLGRLAFARTELTEVALGGTAVGTGLNTHRRFAGLVCRAVSHDAGFEVRETSNHFQAQATLDAAVSASGAVRTVAISLGKIVNDVRWLASGPRTGLGELSIPAVQPGSSIMPGKVNPVLAEALIQVCCQACASDLALVQAGQWGCFELNTMLPLAAHNLVPTIETLGTAADAFERGCARGIEATGRGPEMVERGLALATGLVPRLGYDRAAAIAKQAARSGRTVREVALEATDLGDDELRELLDPLRMTEPEG